MLQKENLKLLVSTVLVASFAIALSWTGMLQRFELMLLDTYFKLRPEEAAEKRIVVVGLTEKDIKELRRWPISDKQLAQLLNNIKKQRPRAIGLDIYRDIPVEPGHQELVKVFKNTPELTGVQKVIGDDFSPQIAPPPILNKLGKVSASDLVLDEDKVVRRATLIIPIEDNQGITSLGLEVALKYLRKQGIKPEFDDKATLKLNEVSFAPLKKNDGGYVRVDVGGYQIILNYRGAKQGFQRISFSEVINNRVSSKLMHDKIVLVGTVAPSVKDHFYTPYSSLNNYLATSPIPTPGVEIQAQIASQIISTVLDKRSAIRVVDNSLENLSVLIVSLLVVVISFKLSNYKFFSTFKGKTVKTIIIFLLASVFNIILFSGVYLAFLSGFWIPVIPSFIALNISALLFVIYNYDNKLNTATSKLEQTNQNFSLALDATSTGILSYNFFTNQISITGSCDTLFGWKTDVFSGQLEDLVKHIHFEDREEFVRLMKSPSPILDDQSNFELKFRCFKSYRKPKTSWVHIKGKTCYASTRKAIGVIGAITDITDMKELQQNFEEEAAFLQVLTRNIFDTILTLDYELIIQTSTPSIKANFGYSVAEEVLDQHILDFIHSNDAPFVLESLMDTIYNPAKIFHSECRFLHRNGEWKRVECLGHLDNNVVKGVVLTIRKVM